MELRLSRERTGASHVNAVSNATILAHRPAAVAGGCGRTLHLMLANAWHQPSGGGESGIEAAFEALFAHDRLWIVLAVMIMVGAVMGSMPRWAAWLAGLLVPRSAIANFHRRRHVLARHAVGHRLFRPAAAAGRLLRVVGGMPRLHAALPAERTSVAVWASIFGLSAATFVLAA